MKKRLEIGKEGRKLATVTTSEKWVRLIVTVITKSEFWIWFIYVSFVNRLLANACLLLKTKKQSENFKRIAYVNFFEMSVFWHEFLKMHSLCFPVDAQWRLYGSTRSACLHCSLLLMMSRKVFKEGAVPLGGCRCRQLSKSTKHRQADLWYFLFLTDWMSVFCLFSVFFCRWKESRIYCSIQFWQCISQITSKSAFVLTNQLILFVKQFTIVCILWTQIF